MKTNFCDHNTLFQTQMFDHDNRLSLILAARAEHVSVDHTLPSTVRGHQFVLAMCGCSQALGLKFKSQC